LGVDPHILLAALDTACEYVTPNSRLTCLTSAVFAVNVAAVEDEITSRPEMRERSVLTVWLNP
jgi:hypothetical protein